MSCAFTDATSTHYGTSRSDCRGCRKPKVQILCGYCEPGVDVSRCSSCYQKFASTIAKRIPDLEQKTNGKVFMQPALSALLTEGFDELARTGAPGKLDEYVVKVSDGVWRWRDRCPCCYTFTVPDVEARMPDDFASMNPRTRTEVVDFETRQLHHDSGFIKPEPVPVRVEVVRCKEIISDSLSKGVRFRPVDPPVHDKYACFWKPPPEHPDGCAVALSLPLPLTLTLTLTLTITPNRREGWRLLVSDPTDPDEAPTCLSLVRFNALACVPNAGQTGAAFLDTMRRSSAFHKGGGATVDGQMRGSTATSAIRVNRVGGPFGGLRSGSDFNAARLLVRPTHPTHPNPPHPPKRARESNPRQHMPPGPR